MKLHLPSLLRTALLACFAFPAITCAEVYVAEGVNRDDLLSSTQFYDGGKGCYWEYTDTYDAFRKYKSYSFLGDLYTRIDPAYREGRVYTADAFINLTGDSNHCWAYTAANMIQYWQIYYGVFSHRADELTHGYTYNKEDFVSTGGTQSLKLNMLFYDNWQDVGGNLIGATSWYMGGSITYAEDMKPGYSSGGYFAEYYTNTIYRDAVSNPESMSSAVLAEELGRLLGYTRGADGQYELTSKGQLVYISIAYYDERGTRYGHALTCYGFETDEQGNLVSLLFTDSDDAEYSLRSMYLKKGSDGLLYLYLDEACTQRYGSAAWSLERFVAITTPQSLRDMYAEYSSAETPMVWTGASSTWGGEADTFTADAIPDASTGWQVYVDDGGAEHAGNYATYFEDGRKVKFGDVQGDGAVNLARDVSVSEMLLNNATTHYTFAGAGYGLTTDTLDKEGAGRVSFNQVNLHANTVTLRGGRTELGEGTTLTGGVVTVNSGATLDFNGAAAQLTSITVSSGGALDFSARTTLTLNQLSCLNGSDLTFSVFSGGTTLSMGAGSLIIQGSLTLDLGEPLAVGSYTLASAGSIVMRDPGNYTLSGSALSSTSNQSVELSIEDSATRLVLHVVDGMSLTWSGGNGEWNLTNTKWQVQGGATQSYEQDAYVFFEGDAAATVSTAEDVRAKGVTISGGQYSFENAERLSISNSLRLQSSEGKGGVATFDAAPVFGEGASISVADSASSLTISKGDVSVKSFSNDGIVSLGGGLTVGSAVSHGGTLSAASVTLADSSDNTFSKLVSTGAVSYNGAAGSLTVGDSSQLGALAGGTLILSGGDVSIADSGQTSLVALSGQGDLTVSGALALAEASSLTGNLSVGGTLSVGSSMTLSGSLTTSHIHLGQLAEDTLLQVGVLKSSAVNVTLSSAAQTTLLSFSLTSGQSCTIVELGDSDASLALSVNGASSFTLGMYDYAISKDATSHDIILTATLGNVIEWTSTDKVLDSADDCNGSMPGSADVLALLGKGTSEVNLAEAKSIQGLVVEHSGDNYRLTGERLEVGELNVSLGGLEVANAATVVTGDVVVGTDAQLVVVAGSSLEADGSMHVFEDLGLVNAGTTVLSGTMNAGSNRIVNTGSLSVGSGDSSIGALVTTTRSGAGDFSVAAGGRVSILGDSVIGLLDNDGEISMADYDLQLGQATEKGGILSVHHLELADGNNAFDRLDAASVAGHSGLLSLGSGSAIRGSLSGGGELVVNGDVLIEEMTDSMSQVTIASGATLSTNAALTVKGTFQSLGSLNASGCTVTFSTPVEQGGNVVAGQLVVSSTGSNSFGDITTSAFTFVGPLSDTGALLSANSLTPAAADQPIAITITGAGTPSGDFLLLETGSALSAESFTLNSAFVSSCLRADVQVSLVNGDGGTIYLQMLGRDPNYYANHASSANGRAAGSLLDNVRRAQGADRSGDLGAFVDLLEQSIAAGVPAEQLDAMTTAVVGASIPAMSVALAGDTSRQLRAIRNRTTSMGVDSRYEHPDMPYYNAWITAEGGYRELSAGGGAAGYKLSNWGGSVGVDVDLTESLTMGFACTALYGDFTAASADMAEGDMDTCYASVFARVPVGRWVHTFVVTAGLADLSLERTVSTGGLSYATQGSTNGFTLGALYEVACTFSLAEDESVCWQPMANVSVVHAAVDAYSETGSDAALQVGEQDFNMLSLGVGARLQAVVGENIYNRSSVLELRAMLKADLGDRKGEADLGFVSLPGYSASMKSNEYGAFGVELGAGLSIPVSARAGELFFDLSADLRADQCEVNGAAGWRVHF